MPQAWRIVTRKRVQGAFDGEGARLFGGRWNSPGKPMVYLAGSRALAALEMLVHLHPAMAGKMTFARFSVEFPPRFVEELDSREGPVFDSFGPSVSPLTQAAGDAWLKNGIKPLLRVPSAIIPEEPNYLLNPRHPACSELLISEAETFSFDPRLLSPVKDQ